MITPASFPFDFIVLNLMYFVLPKGPLISLKVCEVLAFLWFQLELSVQVVIFMMQDSLICFECCEAPTVTRLMLYQSNLSSMLIGGTALT